jgi:hypothetical protein
MILCIQKSPFLKTKKACLEGSHPYPTTKEPEFCWGGSSAKVFLTNFTDISDILQGLGIYAVAHTFVL